MQVWKHHGLAKKVKKRIESMFVESEKGGLSLLCLCRRPSWSCLVDAFRGVDVLTLQRMQETRPIPNTAPMAPVRAVHVPHHAAHTSTHPVTTSPCTRMNIQNENSTREKGMVLSIDKVVGKIRYRAGGVGGGSCAKVSSASSDLLMDDGGKV